MAAGFAMFSFCSFRKVGSTLALVVSLVATATATKPFMWGGNPNGECDSPRKLTDVVKAAGGHHHSLAIRRSGAVAAWGLNTNGQCDVPTGLTSVTQVAGGDAHSLALQGGLVRAWGSNNVGQCDIPAGLSGVVEIAAGHEFSMALYGTNDVIAWGRDDLDKNDIPADLLDVAHIAAGRNHALALQTNGKVRAWGDNGSGQCNVPSLLANVVAIAAGADHSLAVTSSGNVVAWGKNTDGQCNVPAGLSGITRVVAGEKFSLAMSQSGAIFVWGRVPTERPGPIQVSGAVDIGAGFGHAMVVSKVAVQLDQSEVFGGGSAEGMVSLLEPASGSGTVVTLTTNDPKVSVPATVTVPAGLFHAFFPVTTQERGGNVAATVKAQITGAFLTAPLKVNGFTVSPTLNRPSVIGGSRQLARITWSVPTPPSVDLTLGLVSRNTALATVPSTITIPAGQTSVTVDVTHKPVGANREVQFTVFESGRPISDTYLQLLALRGSLTVDPDMVVGGNGSAGTVRLVASVAQPLTVNLTSTHSAVTVPTSVTIPAGQFQATFPIGTSSVPATISVGVNASIVGVVTGDAILVLNAPKVSSLTLPTTVNGHGRIVGTVRLDIAARPGGARVDLSASGAGLSLPASLTVPEGQTSATFELFADDVSALQNVTVTAASGLGSASAGVEIRPLALSSITLSTATIQGGGTLTGTVTLNAIVAQDTVVQLVSADARVSVPATVLVPAGSRTVTFPITTAATAQSVFVRITATKHASSLFRTLKVTP